MFRYRCTSLIVQRPSTARTLAAEALTSTELFTVLQSSESVEATLRSLSINQLEQALDDALV
jgi:hypothetical protein